MCVCNARSVSVPSPYILSVCQERRRKKDRRPLQRRQVGTTDYANRKENYALWQLLNVLFFSDSTEPPSLDKACKYHTLKINRISLHALKLSGPSAQLWLLHSCYKVFQGIFLYGLHCRSATMWSINIYIEENCP